MAKLEYVTGLSQSGAWLILQYLTDYGLLIKIVFIIIFGAHHGHLTFLFCSSCILHTCLSKQVAFRLLARRGCT